jgi:hypothetical protein
VKRLLLLSALALAVASVFTTSASGGSQAPRPMKGDCSTTFSFAGFKDGNTQVPLFHITGVCHFTHLGLAAWDAVQAVYPNGTLENDGTYTAANGDTLSSHMMGTGDPISAGPLVHFQFQEWFTSGTGRFANVVIGNPATDAPAATGSGWANLAESAGWFASAGSITY